eukprot:TRINITY_DN11147_c0_g1_i1.p1 TRINITY_DN11147_c0_g1~~TRINITY_DN11147_c0_g1_i1.p1  ORF type:complete len:295 (-),score=48.43 TRINITY_DN11147_c0_g1_i1:12-854(-)
MSSNADQINFTVQSECPYSQIQILPLVQFSIVDHFLRRGPKMSRVIGTLTGTIQDGVVTVKNCFPVPHVEANELMVYMEYHKNRLRLHKQVYPDERIVGWYATAPGKTSALIDNFYFKEMNSTPVHVMVVPSLKSGNVTTKCFYGREVKLGGNLLQHHFQPIKHINLMGQQEVIGLNVLLNSKDDELEISDYSSLQASMTKLDYNLDHLIGYVNKVISGDVEQDPFVASEIDEILSNIPSEFNWSEIFMQGSDDYLTGKYLSELSMAHIKLAEISRNSEE